MKKVPGTIGFPSCEFSVSLFVEGLTLSPLERCPATGRLRCAHPRRSGGARGCRTFDAALGHSTHPEERGGVSRAEVVLQPLGYVPAVQAALRMPESSLEEATGFGEGGGSSADPAHFDESLFTTGGSGVLSGVLLACAAARGLRPAASGVEGAASAPPPALATRTPRLACRALGRGPSPPRRHQWRRARARSASASVPSSSRAPPPRRPTRGAGSEVSTGAGTMSTPGRRRGGSPAPPAASPRRRRRKSPSSSSPAPSRSRSSPPASPRRRDRWRSPRRRFPALSPPCDFRSFFADFVASLRSAFSCLRIAFFVSLVCRSS
mmetsp:Transcript_104906/g.292736  ORF Transcript_104906/g.292736 Transcript_104906/m.292736 type:complete len:322 (+) Transcript_104906:481-1446(+)